MREHKRETLPVGILAYGVVALLIVVAAWQFIFDQQGSIGSAPPKVQQGKLAILPFINQTEIQAYDELGYITADWMTQALYETRPEHIVLPDEVRDHLDLADLTGKSREFADATDANYYLIGRYSRENDSLILLMRLIGATSGMGIERFPDISSAIKDPMHTVAVAAHMIQLYFEVDSTAILNVNPPNYEAYQSYIQAHSDSVGAPYQLLANATERDRDFYAPWIKLLSQYRMAKDTTMVDSVMHILESRSNRLLKYEQNLLDEIGIDHEN